MNMDSLYKWYIGVFVSQDIVLFVLAPRRSAEVPGKVLFNLNATQLKLLNTTPFDGEKKILSSDRFSAYKLLKRLGLVELAFCWAHQRRDFIKLKTKYPSLQPWADEWIERIAYLYHINNERIEYSPQEPAFEAYQLQLQQAVSHIHSLLYENYDHPKQIALMQSMQEHWKGLTLFVQHPEIPIDNNLALSTGIYNPQDLRETLVISGVPA